MWWQLRACARHPQIAVVMSRVLAVVGTGLGIVGLAAVLKEAQWPGSVWQAVVSWQAVAALGFVVFVLGFWRSSCGPRIKPPERARPCGSLDTVL